jgi:hypothetical protein
MSAPATPLEEARLALLSLALVAWGHRRRTADSPYQRRLAAELSQVHRVLSDQRDAVVEPDSPLQLVHAAIDYAEARGVSWADIVALVNRRARLPEGAR